LLQSEDSIIRHLWLFRDQGVEFSAEEIETEEFYYDGGEKEIGNQHCQALVEIFKEKGGQRDK
jgi:hypothetical protein